MAVIVNVFVLVVLGAIAVGVVWAAYRLAIRVVFGRRAGHRFVAPLVSIGIVAMTVGAVAVYQTRPAAAFEREFGFALPADTVVEQSSSFALGDSGSAHLLLRTTPATVARIVTAADLRLGGPIMGTGRPPRWFIAPSGRGVCRFSSQSNAGSLPRPPGAAFWSEYRCLTFDPATGRASYEYLGVD